VRREGFALARALQAGRVECLMGLLSRVSCTRSLSRRSRQRLRDLVRTREDPRSELMSGAPRRVAKLLPRQELDRRASIVLAVVQNAKRLMRHAGSHTDRRRVVRGDRSFVSS
jgi:hypothetical protein